MDKNNLRIDITDVEAIDFNEEMPAEFKEKLKADIVEVVSKEPKKTLSSRWRIAVIAAVLVVLVSATSVVASMGNVTKKPKEKQNTVPATTESSQKATKNNHYQSNEDVVKPPVRKYVTINFDGIESYAVVDNHNGWHTLVHSDGYSAGKDVYCQLIYVDSKDCFDKLKSKAESWESLTVSEKTAYYKTVENHKFFTQQLYVLCDDYMLNFMAGSNLDKESLLNCASSVSLLDANSRDDASLSKSLSRHYEYAFEVEDEIRTSLVESSYIHNMGEAVEYNGCLYEVAGVTAYDNILEFTQTPADGTYSGMKPALTENISEIMSSDGELLPCSRVKTIMGNGYSTPKRAYIAQDFIFQKFILVELKVKNTLDSEISDVNVGYRIQQLHQEDGEMYVNDRQHQREGAYRLCQENKLPAYYGNTIGGIISLEPQEEKVVTLGYFVDEDRLDQTYLSIGLYQYEDGVYTPQIYLGAASAE